MRAWPRWPAAAPWGWIERGALLADGERLRWVGPEGDLPAALARRRRTRPRRRAGDAGADRLPHAPRLRRPPRARVRAAAAGRHLRRDRARRRRHPLHRGGHARGRATTRCSPARATRALALMAEGVTTIEDQVRLRPEPRRRGALPARGAPARPRAAADGAHHQPGRARPAAGVRRPRRRLHRRRRAVAAVVARRRAGRCGRCVLRQHRLHAGADAARLRRRARAAGCR